MMETGRIPGIAIVLLVGTYVVSGCGDDGGPSGPAVGPPSQLAFITEASDGTAGGAITPAPQVAIRDASSNLVTSATNAVTVELASNPGGGTLMGTTTVSAVAGVATFSDLSVDKVGAGFTLRATSGNLQSATTASFDISPAAPAALAFRVEPSDGEVNLAMAPAVGVGVEDEFGNAVTTATNAVTLAIGTNPAGGTLTGTTTVDAVGGVASFTDLEIDKTGDGYTFVAMSGALATATSDTFDINFPIALITAAGAHTCGLTGGGNSYCWGQNSSGQLGDGTTIDRPSPVGVIGGLSFTSLSAGDQGLVGRGHVCGFTSGGEAHCWGDNSFGQLGDGTSTGSAVPVSVSGGLSFSALEAGALHTCGVTTGGDAYCWGGNAAGELGDGTQTDRPAPAAVIGGLSFAAVTAGVFHTCGVASDTTAHCWGGNTFGQLGDSTTTARLTPVLVSGGLNLEAVTVGERHSCGLTTVGDVYCWGRNDIGELGNGTTTDSPTPVPVSGGLSFSAVSGGLRHTCGLTVGGDAYCWGLNGHGQLGDGTTTTSTTPVLVSGGLNFAQVTAGGLHSCGVTGDGTAYCWGRNEFGQLGEGTTTNRSSPVRVSDP